MFLLRSNIVWALCAAAVILCGCERVIFYPVFQENNNTPHNSNNLYASAISFPDGYDWRRDSAGRNVTVKLLLFQGKMPILELKADNLNRISADEDRHWLAGKDIYTVWKDNSSTLIKKNGQDFLSWQESEFIDDLYVCDSMLCTIGHTDSGGLNYRQNGKILLFEDKAVLMDGIHIDEGKVCFSYAKLLDSTEGGYVRQYFIVKDAGARQILPPIDADLLYSIRYHEGCLNTIGNFRNRKNLIWQRGPNASIVDWSAYGQIRNVSLMPISKGLAVHAQASSAGGWQDIWWNTSGIITLTDAGMQVLAVSGDGMNLSFLCSPGARNTGLSLYMENRYEAIDMDYGLFCSGAATFTDNFAVIGVNDLKSMQPVILNGDEVMKYDFNGYFTHFSLP